MTALPRLGGVVLCGGLSTRMGRPKAWLPFGDEFLLQRVVRTLATVVGPIVVVAAADQEVPPLPDGIALVRDKRPALGPLAGIQAGLEALLHLADAAYVSACDAPLLRPEFISHMANLLGDCEIVIPRDGRFHHPLAAVYRTALAGRVRALVDNNRLRPLYLVQESKSLEVAIETLRGIDPSLDSLRNTNTPEDYAAALRDAGLSPD